MNGPDDNETPSSQHQAIRRELTDVTNWRLDRLEDSNAQIMRKLDRLLAHNSEQDSSTKIASERCSGHGIRLDALEEETDEQIRTLHKRIDRINAPGKPSKWTASAAWSALIAALGAIATALTHKGGP